MIKKLILIALLSLVSGCDAMASTVDGLILNKSISDIDTSGFALIDEDNNLVSEPKRMDTRLMRYFYMSSDVAGKKPNEVPHDKKYTMAMFYTLDGNVIFTLIFTDIARMQEMQNLLQDKYGLPLATKTGVRDKAAFESSMAYCENTAHSSGSVKKACPTDYYEIYEGKEQVYSLVEERTSPSYPTRKDRLVISGMTKAGKDYLNR